MLMCGGQGKDKSNFKSRFDAMSDQLIALLKQLDDEEQRQESLRMYVSEIDFRVESICFPMKFASEMTTVNCNRGKNRCEARILLFTRMRDKVLNQHGSGFIH
jgi:hypothetical protein